MTAPTGWAPAGPARYGLNPAGPTSNATTELRAVASPAEGTANEMKPWHPSNPLFWIAALGAVTFGLMAVSTTVRVGPGKASVSLGKP
jgi:hypothetical protein